MAIAILLLAYVFPAQRPLYAATHDLGDFAFTTSGFGTTLTAQCVRTYPLWARFTTNHDVARCCQRTEAGFFISPGPSYTPQATPNIWGFCGSPEGPCGAMCFQGGQIDTGHFTDLFVGPPVAPGTYTLTAVYNVAAPSSCSPIEPMQRVEIGVGFPTVDPVCPGGGGNRVDAVQVGDSVVFRVVVPDVGQTTRLEKVAETDNQTGLVGQALLKPLQARVIRSDGVVKSSVTVSFTLIETPLGPTSINLGSPQTNANGIAGVPFILGSSSGTYKIKALCPDCAANQQVTFTEIAAATFTTITGTIRNPLLLQCSSITIGNITVPVNPDGTYSIPNVPLSTGSIIMAASDIIAHCENPDVGCPTVGGAAICGPRPCGCGRGSYRGRSGGGHKGIDMAGDLPVLSPAAGTVMFVGEFNGRPKKPGDVARNRSFGWIVVIQADQKHKNLQTGQEFHQALLFGHLDVESVPVNVRAGLRVNKGQVIGRTGTTGNVKNTDCQNKPTNCPGLCEPCAQHVHFEVRLSSFSMSPLVNANPTPGLGLDMNSKPKGAEFSNAHVFLNNRGDGRALDTTFGPNENDVNPDLQFGCGLYGKRCE